MRPLRVQLTRAMTYQFAGVHFRRGVPYPDPAKGHPPLDEQTYHRMLRTGKLADPDVQMNSIHPSKLAKSRRPMNVTVVRDMGLGDVLMVLPGLRALQEAQPKHRYTLATDSRYPGLFDDCPFLAGALPIVELTGRHDAVIDLRGYSERAHNRATLPRPDVFADYLGVQIRDRSYPYRVKPFEAEEARAMLAGAGEVRIGLVVRSSEVTRSWDIERVWDFALLAIDAGWSVVVLDQEPLDVPPGLINLTGTMTVRQLAAVVAECTAVLSPDTGTLHLCEAVGTPCVGMFSTVDPALRTAGYRYVQGFRTGTRCEKMSPEEAVSHIATMIPAVTAKEA